MILFFLIALILLVITVVALYLGNGDDTDKNGNVPTAIIIWLLFLGLFLALKNKIGSSKSALIGGLGVIIYASLKKSKSTT